MNCPYSSIRGETDIRVNAIVPSFLIKFNSYWSILPFFNFAKFYLNGAWDFWSTKTKSGFPDISSGAYPRISDIL